MLFAVSSSLFETGPIHHEYLDSTKDTDSQVFKHQSISSYSAE